MPSSHWAFSALAMPSPWKVTSSGGVREGFGRAIANFFEKHKASGGIGKKPKYFNACNEILPEPLVMFCREKCSGDIRGHSWRFPEQSWNIHRYFFRCLWKPSVKYRRLFVIDISVFVMFWDTSVSNPWSIGLRHNVHAWYVTGSVANDALIKNKYPHTANPILLTIIWLDTYCPCMTIR